MGGIQIENLLSLMESGVPLNHAQARREVTEYLNGHLATVALELQRRGEAFIQTPSGTFRLTKEDLSAA